MGFPPRIGRAVTSSAGDLTETPVAKTVGSIDLDTLNTTPTFEESGPPPWEVDKGWLKHNTDARRFITCPETWELRWLNPRLIDQAGFRDWQVVKANDERVTLKVPAMRTPEHYIRRGGLTGDLLCFMPRHWVESRRRVKAEQVARRTQAARDRMEQFKDEMARGNFGPHQAVTEAKHPTHTLAEGRSLDKE